MIRLASVVRHCPNCHLVAAEPWHACPKMAGLMAPLIPAGTRAKVERVERMDYVGHECVQRDGNGRPVMSIVTTRDDGTDLVIFAPMARGFGAIPAEFAHNSWSASKVFSAFVTDAFNGTAAFDLNSDTIEAALFDNSITPDQTVAAASSAYAAGVWASGGVVDTGSSAPAGWPALGRPLVPTSTFASNVYTFDSADTVSANGVTTITAAYGTLIYDHTLASPVADQGICYIYFGGTNSVTLGTVTIAWHGSGIFDITL